MFACVLHKDLVVWFFAVRVDRVRGCPKGAGVPAVFKVVVILASEALECRIEGSRLAAYRDICVFA